MRSLHRAHVDAFLARAIPSTPGLRGLHAACGLGERGLYRPSPSQRWFGFDLLGGDVRADFHAIPFRSGSFDLVRCSEALYFVRPQSLAGVLGELRRVLKMGGRFVATVPALFPPICEGDQTRLTPFAWRRILPYLDVEIVRLGGLWTTVVTFLEHVSRVFSVLRPLARLDARYPHVATAYGLICE